LQGRIAGIAMALRMNGSQTSSGIELTDQKLAEIEALLASVIVDVQGLFKVADIKQEASIVIKLINLRRSWNGIADVTWKIDPEVFSGMKSEWLEKLSEILYEAVSNSVRHGGADKVFLEFKVNDRKLILSITDNGSGIKSDFVPSVGLHKITEFGAEYEFATDREAGAELIIKINLAN
jgi:signal transduction histidine kinase